MYRYFWGSLAAVPAGFLLDLIFGDPSTPLHPICLIGTLIAKLENGIRRITAGKNQNATSMNAKNTSSNSSEKDEASFHRTEFYGGMVMALLVIMISTGIPLVLICVCYRVNFWLGVILEAVMCFFLFAVKSLKKESMNVKHALESDTPREMVSDTSDIGLQSINEKTESNTALEAGRKAISRIVGRDTQALSKEGVVRAAVETVAENFSDGVFAPMFYMFIGGGVLGFTYKSINTMDSMIGYKNEKYLYFGRFAAKLDDVVNVIPSRLAALFLIIAAPFVGLDGRNAFRIWRRDRRNHASPNSAQTESAAAGALHVQLAGDAYYFGTLYKKPFIGDDDRPIETEDIARVNSLMVTASVLSLIVMSMIKAFLLCLFV